jgi:hypothetical protein
MVEPRRVQLSRKRGWRMPENTVKVTRPGKWGNPFNLRSADHCWTAVAHGFRGDRLGRQAASVAIFRAWVLNGKADGVACGFYAERNGETHALAAAPAIEAKAPPTVAEIRERLAGKNLACWCKIGEPCHGDVLLKIANASPPLPMTSIQEEIPADIRGLAKGVLFDWLDPDDIPPQLIEDVAAALLAERNRAYEECAGIADQV